MVKFHWFIEDQPMEKAINAYRLEQPYGFLLVLRMFTLTLELDLIYNRFGIDSNRTIDHEQFGKTRQNAGGRKSPE